jgi:hypothetical protein
MEYFLIPLLIKFYFFNFIFKTQFIILNHSKRFTHILFTITFDFLPILENNLLSF